MLPLLQVICLTNSKILTGTLNNSQVIPNHYAIILFYSYVHHPTRLPYVLGPKENLPPIFKTLMILVMLLELGIQLLILGVTQTFLAQFSVAKGISHDFASRSDNTFPSDNQSHSIEVITSSRPTWWRYPIYSCDPPRYYFYLQEDGTSILHNG